MGAGKKYYIIAGEASGDLHGSNLMKGLYAEDKDAAIRFWGGDLMEETCRKYASGNVAAGAGLVRHYKEGAIMGFWEVFARAGRLLGNIKYCKKDIDSWDPDVVILIDYPGFNFKIAEYAHKKGRRVFYYIAPKVWASREGRIKKLKKYVDRLFIVFPFEIPYFKSKGVDFIYKGNPLTDAVDDSPAMKESRQDFLARNGLDDRPFIAMLAGSRKGEIRTMMPVLAEFAGMMRQIPEYSSYRFLVAGAPARSAADYAGYIDGDDSNVKVLFGETQSIIRHAEAAVVNSGTASLETVLINTPQVVGYICPSRITYLIARRIIKIKYISLGNLIAGRCVFRELIQDECSAAAIVEEIRRILEDTGYREKMLEGYSGIRKALGDKGASRAVARAMIEELERNQ